MTAMKVFALTGRVPCVELVECDGVLGFDGRA